MIIDRKIYRGYDALNASYLKQIYSYNVWKANVPTTVTPAMEFGTAAHTLILEPESFPKEYKLFDFDRRTKAGKEAYQAILDGGATPLSRNDVDRLKSMSESVLGHKETLSLLDNQQLVEASMTFDLDCLGFPNLLGKAQIDLFTKDGILMDLKTIADISKAEKQFFNMNYDLQLSYYQLALEANGYEVSAVRVLFVETQPPYQCALFDLPYEVILNGKIKCIKAIGKYLYQRELVNPELITGTLEVPPWDVLDDDLSPFS